MFSGSVCPPSVSDCVVKNTVATMPILLTQGSVEKARTEHNIAYIRQMLAELRGIAESEKADMLCNLIEMAYIELGDVLDGCRPLSADRTSR